MAETPDLLKQLEDLIFEAQVLSQSYDRPVGKDRLMRFIQDSVASVTAFEDKLPNVAAQMKRMRWRVVKEEDEESSENAYREQFQDNGVTDFNYQAFARAGICLRALRTRHQADTQSIRAGMHEPNEGVAKSGLRNDVVEPAVTVTLADLANWPDALNENQVAKLLAMKVSTLRKWRVLGKGPRFSKAGVRVRYLPQDVMAYLKESQRRD